MPCRGNPFVEKDKEKNIASLEATPNSQRVASNEAKKQH